MRIKLYEEYQEFTENRSYLIRDYFNKMINTMSNWFSSGLLSKQGCILNQIDQSDENIGTTRTLKLDFNDANYDYTIIILIDHSMFNDDNTMNTCELSIKRYDGDGNMNKIEETNCDISNLTEEYIVTKISEMTDENNQKI